MAIVLGLIAALAWGTGDFTGGMAARQAPETAVVLGTESVGLVLLLGCAFFVAHVVCAFSFYHHWSHAAAYLETARQTGEMTGFRWGGGIFLNYLIAAAWAADVLWWWLAPENFARRSTLGGAGNLARSATSKTKSS